MMELVLSDEVIGNEIILLLMRALHGTLKSTSRAGENLPSKKQLIKRLKIKAVEILVGILMKYELYRSCVVAKIYQMLPISFTHVKVAIRFDKQFDY